MSRREPIDEPEGPFLYCFACRKYFPLESNHNHDFPKAWRKEAGPACSNCGLPAIIHGATCDA